jgi:lipid II:glycine glycyltransferase (peptidoglycan interpeptide bridge formation enzyme)
MPSDEYSVEVDRSSRQEWTGFLDQFDDRTLMHTWEFPEAMCPGQQVSRVVVRRGGDMVGVAQVRTLALPVWRRGVAQVAWGPLWRKRGRPLDRDALAATIRGLRDEFALRRRLFLRIVPYVPGALGDAPAEALAEAGFRVYGRTKPYRSMWIDLARPLEEVRRGFEKEWRRLLGKAERNGLEIVEGTSPDLLREMIPVYRQMVALKGFQPDVPVERWVRLQELVPEEERPRAFLARHAGEVVAGFVVSGLGETALPLLAASASEGRRLLASYALWWRCMEWLRHTTCRNLDVGGVDPEENEGTYRFKKGLGGVEVTFIAAHAACESPVSRLIAEVGEPLRDWARKARQPKGQLPPLSTGSSGAASGAAERATGE